MSFGRNFLRYNIELDYAYFNMFGLKNFEFDTKQNLPSYLNFCLV